MLTSQQLKLNPLDLADGDLVFGTDSCQVLIDTFLDLVVCGHFMFLAAFFVKPQPIVFRLT
jgi:hypothetical protein